jgi:hypothetical protein
MAETPWIRALARAERQALEDVARTHAAEVVFVRSPTPARGSEWLDRAEGIARDMGFVTARIGVFRERAFDELDVLVRAIARGLRTPDGKKDEHGLAAMLERVGDRRGLRTALARGPIGSELFDVARAFLDAIENPVRQANRIDAWLSGIEERQERAKLPALTKRRAKRAFGDLTLLVRALGYRGTAIFFEGTEILTKLPPARREQAYVVLRELVDNADGGRGLAAVRILVEGGPALFSGPRSVEELEPLATRMLAPPLTQPLPHATVVDLDVVADEPAEPGLKRATAEQAGALRAVLRACHGLPATDPEHAISVATDRIDRSVNELLELSLAGGSVFTLLSGAYGSGKTHLLLYLAARARKEKRPVFRLSLERLDADLGNPQRHLYRLLDQSQLPLPGAPSALDVLAEWTATAKATSELVADLRAIASAPGDAASAADRIVTAAAKDEERSVVALRSLLSAQDLLDKTGSPAHRRDAYERLLLWLALLERRHETTGPVLVIDEAENLYRSGIREGERRTALRSLSFYAGGALPGACVVLAITPEALTELRRDARDLLEEISDQSSLLAWEDASLFKGRLKKSKVLEVPPLDAKELALLATKLRKLHREARGEVDAKRYRNVVNEEIDAGAGPRALTRAAIAYLENVFWNG